MMVARIQQSNKPQTSKPPAAKTYTVNDLIAYAKKEVSKTFGDLEKRPLSKDEKGSAADLGKLLALGVLMYGKDFEPQGSKKNKTA